VPPFSPPEALTVESVRIPVDGRELEGELVYGDETPAGAVVLAGPHPLLGGDMGNNVVRGLGDGLARLGHVTLRFNYRGVSADAPPAGLAAQMASFWATAQAPDDPGRGDDLRAAARLLRSVVGPDLPLALVGYSFGCSLLPSALHPGDASSALAAVAPTVGAHDHDAYRTIPNPKLVIAPQDDFAADAARLTAWFDALPGPKRLLRPRLDGHFFRGHEDWLAAAVGAFLDDLWS
jgi:alpha/beta superfamily hydrolase